MSEQRVAVVGAGSWGTAVAALAGAQAPTTVWARRAALAQAINVDRCNHDYLPEASIPDTVRATADLAEAVTGAAVVVMAVPSHGFRTVLAEAADDIDPDATIISLTKGIEQGTLARMTEVVAAEMQRPDGSVGVLTGPNLAREIAVGQPAATVVAIGDEARALSVQQLFMNPTFRVYTNPDVIGCESAGALKNVMALAAGMAHGLGYGDNSKAALITRALAELTRLGVALGGKPLTFAGLAGMGDLIATCISEQSRNRTVGVRLGEGKPIAQIVDEMKMVAEGVKTTEAVLQLARRHDLEMPIAEAVGAVLYEGRSPTEMVESLMTREAKAELHGIA